MFLFIKIVLEVGLEPTASIYLLTFVEIPGLEPELHGYKPCVLTIRRYLDGAPSRIRTHRPTSSFEIINGHGFRDRCNTILPILQFVEGVGLEPTRRNLDLLVFTKPAPLPTWVTLQKTCLLLSCTGQIRTDQFGVTIPSATGPNFY